MSKPDDFRRYAQRCNELARRLDAPEAETLTAMAQDWVRLAEDEERIADLIRDADRAFAPMPALASDSQPAFWESDRRFH